MAKFVNNSDNDVFIDLGKLILIRPGEVIDLPKANSCPPLTIIPPKTKRKKPQAPPKKSSAPPASGTI